MSISIRPAALAAALLVATLAAGARAAVEAQTMALSTEDVTGILSPDKQTDPMSASSTQTSGAGTATAMATINGSMTSVEAQVLGDVFLLGGTTAAAAVTEEFTYLTDGSATYTLEVSGTVVNNGAILSLIIAAGQDLGPFDLETLDLTDLNGEGFGWDDELVDGNYSFTTDPFPHSAGTPTAVTFLIALTGSSFSGSYDADFIGTVELTESSKTDFTTGSGNQLNSTVVVIPAPAAIVACPAIVVFWLRRRQQERSD